LFVVVGTIMVGYRGVSETQFYIHRPIFSKPLPLINPLLFDLYASEELLVPTSDNQLC
jgi:hypothetical protein